jgi:poly-gamma-glutamate capsule biosynthesis protein CapA/YwtB (metallophosphatase superfamily)
MLRKTGNFQKYFFFILFISIFSPGKSQEIQDPLKKITFLFIGDIMGHDEQIWSAENRETHTFNYDDVFKYIKPVISQADIAIANFEVTLAGQPYMGYPQFSSPADLASAVKNAGIDYLVTANNHAADRGKKGIVSTISKLDSIGIPHTGTFLNKTSRDSLSPLIFHKDGASVALINYTFSTNGLPVPEPVIVNMLDKQAIAKDVEKAKSEKADIIILFLHWGTEYDTIPSRDQTEMARYFQSIGVDMVIGSHPHVIQKMIMSKDTVTKENRLVVYSLGNFISNQRKPKTDGGSLVRVELTKEADKYIITNAGYILTWVYTPIVNYRKKFFILPCTQFENTPEFFDKPEAFSLMKKFITDSRKLLDEQNVNVKEIRLNTENPTSSK